VQLILEGMCCQLVIISTTDAWRNLSPK